MPDPVTLGVTAVGTAASIIGSSKQAAAAREAAREQTKATKAAMAAQEKALERQIGLQEPFRQSGVNALTEYGTASQYTPFGMDQFNADPGYQFRMSEGLKALERSAASRGILASGETLKNITRFGQDTASQEYENAFQRYLKEREQRLAPLEYRIGIGQRATDAQSGNIGGTAQTTGRMTEDLGNIRASRSIAQGNAFADSMNAISSFASGTAQGYGQMKAANPYQNYLTTITPGASSYAPRYTSTSYGGPK